LPPNPCCHFLSTVFGCIILKSLLLVPELKIKSCHTMTNHFPTKKQEGGDIFKPSNLPSLSLT